ncbi:edcc0b2d-fe98-43bb-93e0-629f6b3950e8 [Thermothielavioides terrestris]|uniref:Edcc0b2d-fe98-43bb-93e0-629f6b3950e8 n=1 Tax=Thermothielavioides terrestris TaxID=2587410 RepID=A0A446B9U0_9PEZI|nr:edcc0b2d-fe98-43bb-93e0-629f6b3950e8 [Thermothielavioides terrestris]
MDGLPITPATQSSQAPPPSLNSLVSSASSLRKERGAIAAQACDTCRSRKQRCDEQRPKCGTCQKFRLECNYREPQPTKKDRTLVEILDRIKNLEGKIDNLSRRGAGPPSTPAYSAQPNSLPSPLPAAPAIASASAAPNSAFQFSDTSSVATGSDNYYQYVPSVHQMLKWPAIRQLFASVQPKLPNIDLSSLEREGPASIVALRRSTTQGLLTDTSVPAGRGSGIGLHNPMNAQAPLNLSNPNWEAMQKLSKAYFDTFNLLCPILNRQSFMSDTLPALFNNGFNQDITATVALLVFALGEVAIAGVEGLPVHAYNGRSSGIRGGSKDRPPGLELFNEARRRMGFHLTECSLENVQIFELASIYYGTCFYPLAFWRMTTSASMACQALITSGLNLELGFPLTGLDKMESVVGLPDFSAPFSDEDYISNQESHFQEHFASQIVLRRLLVDFHGVLSQSGSASSSIGPTSGPFSPVAAYSGVNQVTIRQLALQLEQWRGMLPAHLRWHEDSLESFPNSGEEVCNTALFTPAATPVSPAIPTAQPAPASAVTARFMFTTDLDAPPPRYPYVLDIQAALLRSRYYYTKYLIHRPFLYKALQHPDAVGNDDAVGAAECLKACLKWPVAMSPTCRHKRLVPCSFFFTQNFFGILVLLHLSTTVPILRRIRSTLCGERFEIDAAETVGLYLDWLRDLHVVDASTQWHWEIIKAIYGLDN